MRRFFTITALSLLLVGFVHAEYKGTWLKHFKDPFGKGEKNEKAWLFDDGSVIMSGLFKGSMTFASNTLTGIDGGSAYIVKYAADGTEAWGTYVHGAAKPINMVGDKNGNLYLTLEVKGNIDMYSTGGTKETFTETVEGRGNLLVVCYDNSGKLKWHKMVTATQVDSFEAPVIRSTDIKMGKDALFVSANFNGDIKLGDSTFKASAYSAFGMKAANISSFLTKMSLTDGAFSYSTKLAPDTLGGNSTTDGKIYADTITGDYFWALRLRGIAILEGKDTVKNEYENLYLVGRSLCIIGYNADGTVKWHKNYQERYKKGSYTQYDPTPSYLGKMKKGNLMLAGKFDGKIGFGTDSLAAIEGKDLFAVEINPSTGDVVSKTNIDGAKEIGTPLVAIKGDKVVFAGDFKKEFKLSDKDLIKGFMDEANDVYVLEYDVDTKTTKYNAICGLGPDMVSSLMCNAKLNNLLMAGNFTSVNGTETTFLGQKAASTEIAGYYKPSSYLLKLVDGASYTSYEYPALKDQTVKLESNLNYVLPDDFKTKVQESNAILAPTVNGSKDSIPSWMKFDQSTLTLSGTPKATDVGTITIDVFAADGKGVKLASSFKLTVADGTSNEIVKDKRKTTGVYPTVSSSQFNLLNASHAELYNIAGVLIKKVENKQLIDVSDIRAGIYLIKIKTQKGNYEVHRVVVK